MADSFAFAKYSAVMNGRWTLGISTFFWRITSRPLGLAGPGGATTFTSTTKLVANERTEAHPADADGAIRFVKTSPHVRWLAVYRCIPRSITHPAQRLFLCA